LSFNNSLKIILTLLGILPPAKIDIKFVSGSSSNKCRNNGPMVIFTVFFSIVAFSLFICGNVNGSS